MAYTEKQKCIWHAFNALDEQQTGSVSKSQLKVLTHNIANALGFFKVEEGLQDYKSTPGLSFEDYFFFIKTEVFEKLTDANKAAIEKVDDVCWMVCTKKYLVRENKTVSDNVAYKLWKIFNFLSETSEKDEPVYPLVLDHEEVGFFMEKFTDIMGQKFDEKEFTAISKDIPQFNFPQFLNLIETRCTQGVQPIEIEKTVQELVDEFINDIIKKGFLTKKGHMITNLKERWFVLTPKSLKYYTSQDEKDLKGDIKITEAVKIESLPDKSSHTRQNRFQVVGSDGKSYDICSKDMKSKSKWMRAIQNAIAHASSDEPYQRHQAKERKKARESRRAKEREAEARRRAEMEMMEKQRQELEALKKAREEAEAKLQEQAAIRETEQKRLEDLAKAQAEIEARLNEQSALREADQEKLSELEKQRAEAELRLKEEAMLREEEQKRLEELAKAQAETEAKLKEEAALREAEQQRLKEMEELHKNLEQMLEDERQAKRDEEIVRALQSRLLEEEFQKREELERLKAEQDDLLASERQKREGLEEQQRIQRELLEQERKKLEHLEIERKAADEQLQEATEKLKDAEKAKAAVQARMKEKEKPIGLSRLIQPKPNPFVTHRGYGAFCELEFLKKGELEEIERSLGLRPPEETSPTADTAGDTTVETDGTTVDADDTTINVDNNTLTANATEELPPLVSPPEGTGSSAVAMNGCEEFSGVEL